MKVQTRNDENSRPVFISLGYTRNRHKHRRPIAYLNTLVLSVHKVDVFLVNSNVILMKQLYFVRFVLLF